MAAHAFVKGSSFFGFGASKLELDLGLSEPLQILKLTIPLPKFYFILPTAASQVYKRDPSNFRSQAMDKNVYYTSEYAEVSSICVLFSTGSLSPTYFLR